MRIQYLHASKYGNGAAVATEFTHQMASRGVGVEVNHVRDVRPEALPPADLYVFSSPGRIGRPIGRMRRFLKKLQLPAGTHFAVFTTEMAPPRDKRTGVVLSEEEHAKTNRVVAIMEELLEAKGLVKVDDGRVFVTGLKGPLEEGWQEKVAVFVSKLLAVERTP